MTRLEAIKARADAATEGPWEYVEGEFGEHVMAKIPVGWDEYCDDDPVYGVCAATVESGYATSNLKFIAHTRTDIPWFQARVEEMAVAMRKVPLLMIRAKDAAAIEAALAALDEPEKP